MKELIKYIIGLFLLLGIIYLIVTRFINGDALPKKNNVAQIVTIDAAKPVISKDSSGRTHAEKQIIYLTNDQKELYLRKELDSLRKSTGAKDDQIIALTTAVSKFRYEIKYITDTTDKANRRYIINQKDRWFSARGIIPSDTPIVIEGRDSISLAFIKKGGKRYANISSENKAIEYYGIRSFIVPDKTTNSALGIGLSSQSDFDRPFKYNNTSISGGLKFMSIQSKWMYDVHAGYRYQGGFGLLPYVNVGLYRKLF
jgi:hypothetical protein